MNKTCSVEWTISQKKPTSFFHFCNTNFIVQLIFLLWFPSVTYDKCNIIHLFCTLRTMNVQISRTFSQKELEKLTSN